ncbi:hypothetical protein FRC01_014192, partial [Tulasnella sp. 417]
VSVSNTSPLRPLTLAPDLGTLTSRTTPTAPPPSVHLQREHRAPAPRFNLTSSIPAGPVRSLLKERRIYLLERYGTLWLVGHQADRLRRRLPSVHLQKPSDFGTSLRPFTSESDLDGAPSIRSPSNLVLHPNYTLGDALYDASSTTLLDSRHGPPSPILLRTPKIFGSALKDAMLRFEGTPQQPLHSFAVKVILRPINVLGCPVDDEGNATSQTTATAPLFIITTVFFLLDSGPSPLSFIPSLRPLSAAECFRSPSTPTCQAIATFGHACDDIRSGRPLSKPRPTESLEQEEEEDDDDERTSTPPPPPLRTKLVPGASKSDAHDTTVRLAKPYNIGHFFQPIVEFTPQASSPPLAPRNLPPAPVKPKKKSSATGEGGSIAARSAKRGDQPSHPAMEVGEDEGEANAIGEDDDFSEMVGEGGSRDSSPQASEDGSMTTSPSDASSSSRTPSPYDSPADGPSRNYCIARLSTSTTITGRSFIISSTWRCQKARHTPPLITWKPSSTGCLTFLGAADIINFQDEDGETALTLAVRCRSKRLVKLLLELSIRILAGLAVHQDQLSDLKHAVLQAIAKVQHRRPRVASHSVWPSFRSDSKHQQRAASSARRTRSWVASSLAPRFALTCRVRLRDLEASTAHAAPPPRLRSRRKVLDSQRRLGVGRPKAIGGSGVPKLTARAKSTTVKLVSNGRIVEVVVPTLKAVREEEATAASRVSLSKPRPTESLEQAEEEDDDDERTSTPPPPPSRTKPVPGASKSDAHDTTVRPPLKEELKKTESELDAERRRVASLSARVARRGGNRRLRDDLYVLNQHIESGRKTKSYPKLLICSESALTPVSVSSRTPSSRELTPTLEKENQQLPEAPPTHALLPLASHPEDDNALQPTYIASPSQPARNPLSQRSIFKPPRNSRPAYYGPIRRQPQFPAIGRPQSPAHARKELGKHQRGGPDLLEAGDENGQANLSVNRGPNKRPRVDAEQQDVDMDGEPVNMAAQGASENGGAALPSTRPAASMRASYQRLRSPKRGRPSSRRAVEPESSRGTRRRTRAGSADPTLSGPHQRVSAVIRGLETVAEGDFAAYAAAGPWSSAQQHVSQAPIDPLLPPRTQDASIPRFFSYPLPEDPVK